MVIPALFATLVVALAALLVHRSALVRNHALELDELEQDMTRAVEERYRAYLALEAKVRRILTRLDELDAETREGLTRTGMRLVDLGRALAACDPEAAPSVADEPVAPRAAAPERSVDPDMDIAVWQARLETLAAEKRAEVERQAALVAELTARLEAQQAKAQQRELEPGFEDGSAEPRSTAQELRIWRSRHLALEQETAAELAHLRTRAEEADDLEQRFESIQEEHEALQREVSELRERLGRSAESYELRLAQSEAREAESFARHSQEAAEFQTRIGDLEPFVERERSAREECERLARTCQEQRARQETLSAEFERERNGLVEELAATRAARRDETRAFEARTEELEERLDLLEGASERVGELERELASGRADLERVQGEWTATLGRVGELEAQQARLESELDGARGDLSAERRVAEERGAELAQTRSAQAAAERRVEELEGAHAELVQELEQVRGEARTWRGQAEAAEAERRAKVAELEEQFSVLEELSASLREAAEQHLGRIAELEDRRQSLERDLERRSNELVTTTGRLHDAERTLQAAFALLAQAQESESHPPASP